MDDTPKRQPRVYISGPMTGIPDHNFPAFAEAAARWRSRGYEVANPAENFGGRTDLPRESYLRADVALVAQCDAIAMLPGWQDSRGAMIEYYLATELGLTVYDAVTGKALNGKRTVELMTIDRSGMAYWAPSAHKTSPQPASQADRAMPSDSAHRKERPMARGVLDYFPAAIAEVSHCSLVGNRQHNPGQEMYWAREKSTDHADCIVRHLVDRGALDTDGVRHSAKVAWRALALLQTELEDAAEVSS